MPENHTLVSDVGRAVADWRAQGYTPAEIGEALALAVKEWEWSDQRDFAAEAMAPLGFEE